MFLKRQAHFWSTSHFPLESKGKACLWGLQGVGMSLGCSTLSSGAQFPEAEGFFFLSCSPPSACPNAQTPRTWKGIRPFKIIIEKVIPGA